MKLLVAILVGAAVSETELSRNKREFTPAQCRANCDADYDYAIIEDKDACYAGCGGDDEEEQKHCQK